MVAADHAMRTKWVESVRNEKVSLTEAIKTCRSEWSSLFTDLHDSTSVKGNSSSDGDGVQERPSKQARKELPRIEYNHRNEKICKFFNAGTCSFGKKCKFAHMCNVRGCGKDHTAVEGHKNVA